MVCSNFAVAALIAMLVLMPGVQSNAIAGAVENAFGLDTWITGLIIVVLLGAIIIGVLNQSQMRPRSLYRLWH